MTHEHGPNGQSVFRIRLTAGAIAVACVLAVSPASTTAIAQQQKQAPVVTPPPQKPPPPVRNPKRTNASVPGAVQPPDDVAKREGDPKPAETKPKEPVATKPAEPEAATIPPPATTPPVPGPVPVGPEAEYLAKIDDLIAPVRDFSPSAEDLQRVRDLIGRPTIDMAAARSLRTQINDPAARKLVDWFLLRSGLGEPQEFLAFIEANPAWPERALMLRRAEEQLLTSGGSAARIVAFFKGAEPRTGAGWAALASAYLAEKNEAKAREIATRVWREHELPASLESGFLERFGTFLSEADHKRRLDRLLVDEIRAGPERNERAAFVRRVIPLLPEGERAKAEARLAIFLRAKLAGQLLAALPAEPEGSPVDWGLAFQKVQHFRRIGQYEEAWQILKVAPLDPALITSPDDWWEERRGASYQALKLGNYALAYELVRDAGPLSVNPLKDQQYLAGWLALRFLDKAEPALKHFEASRLAADGPLSKARSDYWAGRALEVLKRPEEAKQRYAAAAVIGDSFHGQLARQKLDGTAASDIRTGLPALPSADDGQRFNALDAVRAAVIAHKAGINRSVMRAFFIHLRSHLATEAEVAMLAHLASALGDPQASLRVGKTGIARGMNLVTYAYPLYAFPAYTPLREPPETAVLLAIARQESEFQAGSISPVGARGILQVMPRTAQNICRDHKIKCDIGRLTTDNAYNAMIGSAFVGDRLVEFRGNYVLTLAGYNAGPGRARQWMREFGDPREASVDPVDWIERIPFDETRDYVQKVLSNIQVYRARLGDEMALRLNADMKLQSAQRRVAVPVVQPAAPPAAPSVPDVKK